jgi:hypothetical protein
MNFRQQAKNTINLRVKQAGQLLAQSRWTECDTRVSPAGMAVLVTFVLIPGIQTTNSIRSTLPPVLRLSLSEIV